MHARHSLWIRDALTADDRISLGDPFVALLATCHSPARRSAAAE